MRRLSRLLSRSSLPPPEHNHDQPATSSPPILRLLNLPTELFLSIEAWLPYENALALSLTCKTIYNLTFTLHKPNPRHNGQEAGFLRLLEKDFPDKLSCPIHERLYPWRKAKTRHYKCPTCISHNRTLTPSIVVCNKGCKSSFYGIFEPERRLMLRYALLGPQYGISTRALDHVCKRAYSKRPNEVTPKIVGDSLMLWRTHHRTVKLDFQHWDDVDIEHFDEGICVHSEDGLQALLAAAIHHARQRRDKIALQTSPRDQSTSPKHWLSPMLFKCHQCATDIVLRSEHTHPNEVVVRFDVFQDLGGLHELSVAQRQVFGAKHDWRQQELTRAEKMMRLSEDLEARYHGVEEEQEEIEGLRAVAGTENVVEPPRAAFLSQWTYSHRRDTPISFRVLPMLPVDVQERYREIQFVPQETGPGGAG